MDDRDCLFGRRLTVGSRTYEFTADGADGEALALLFSPRPSSAWRR
ncbi:hypothetical protein K1W54_38340 [Micromonospora sp. CPCC 205371]|nr:hypothetical protein [Micromonospora sp. CPCC 205371]